MYTYIENEGEGGGGTELSGTRSTCCVLKVMSSKRFLR